MSKDLPQAEPSYERSLPKLGWCAQEVQDEFPELHLISLEVPFDSSEHNPTEIKEQLDELSNRWRGARAVNLRREPIPAAYRIFFRHIGLDPDVSRTPIEAAIFDRLMHGGFASTGLLEDILLGALVETSVPVWALDSKTLDGPLGIRLSKDGEALGRSAKASALQGARLVVADASNALAVLFGEVAHGHKAKTGTRELTLFTLQVAGVPSLHVEETLWMCVSALTGERS